MWCGKRDGVMSNKWYTRPVLLVTDIDRSVDFYVNQLGFKENWRFEPEPGKASVAQVSRPGLELILEADQQWPDKIGKSLMFISLDAKVLDALRTELEGRGVNVKDGVWGYHVMIIKDPDGHEFYFAYDDGLKVEGTLKRS
jgi:catechol 2,3-dioxygenase-like lactoylglutathione lyase family enzyme